MVSYAGGLNLLDLREVPKDALKTIFGQSLLGIVESMSLIVINLVVSKVGVAKQKHIGRATKIDNP